jgi:hypothetical protein
VGHRWRDDRLGAATTKVLQLVPNDLAV